MKNVEVIKIPVRYEGHTYTAGQSFEMASEHVDEKLVKVLGDVEQKPKTINEMTVAELKSYAAEHEVDLGDASVKKDILEVIQAHEEQKQKGD